MSRKIHVAQGLATEVTLVPAIPTIRVFAKTLFYVRPGISVLLIVEITMRRLVLSICVATFVIGGALSPCHAQSAIIDLSKPQIGKSRYVLGTDLKPVDFAAVDIAKPAAIAAPAQGWCATGCAMNAAPAEDQPAQASAATKAASRTAGVVLLASAQRGAQPGRSAGFRFKFRRR